MQLYVCELNIFMLTRKCINMFAQTHKGVVYNCKCWEDVGGWWMMDDGCCTQGELKEIADQHEEAFYTERMASVEIARHGRLERLHFRMPEVAVMLKDNKPFHMHLDDTLFHVNPPCANNAHSTPF
jgi:hypothetical protein